MADDFRQDPHYQKTKGGMLGSAVKTVLWAGAALALAGLASGAGTLGMIAYGAAALWAGFKAWGAHKDGQAGMAEVTAHRTAHHVMKHAVAMQQEQSLDQDGPGDDRWQRAEAARRAAAQAQSASR
jgi:hypothetical protein